MTTFFILSSWEGRLPASTYPSQIARPAEAGLYVPLHKSRMLHDDLHALPAIGPEQADRRLQFSERHHVADQRFERHLASLDERDGCGVVLGLRHARADQ